MPTQLRKTTDGWQPPAAGRGRKGSSPRGFGGSVGLLTPWLSLFRICYMPDPAHFERPLLVDLWHPEPWENTFLLFEPIQFVAICSNSPRKWVHMFRNTHVYSCWNNWDDMADTSNFFFPLPALWDDLCFLACEMFVELLLGIPILSWVGFSKWAGSGMQQILNRHICWMNAYMYEWWTQLCLSVEVTSSCLSLIQLSVGSSLVWCSAENGLERQASLQSCAVWL